MFNQAYAAALAALKIGPWYVEVNMDNGALVWPTFQSLQCFWPGIQALVGDLEAAAETMEAFYRIWLVHGAHAVHRRPEMCYLRGTVGAVPEGFNLHKKGVPSGQAGYPLRPELAESAMYMHQATLDPIYLEIGKQMVRSLQTITRVPCGFARCAKFATKLL